ncbi:MAG TPA: tRNA-dihydrouridine synthase [Candidatus Kapabacteria bacterium]|nr:tRNA-dihydrouridine synthase [Candidatus Kapabacteria bacterium]
MPILLLAPMEGLTDFHMRDVLTRLGHYDWCVTEFIRVTDRVHPARVFFHACPELHTGGLTAAGTPVHVQLLGSDANMLAANAARAVELGALAIDLNFGCPAKTVNNHGGGAVLLDTPETVHAIVRAVRAAVPADVPVSAKMRLGVKDRSRMIENAQGIEAAGAQWLTVHARTKEDGYRPPAHWEAIAEIRSRVQMHVIANGEIWTPDDAVRCREVSGCDDLMLGRGAVTRPDLVNRIRTAAPLLSWTEMVQAQQAFLDHMEAARRVGALPSPGDLEQEPARWTERGAIGRYKQWLGMLTRGYVEAVPLFDQVKRMKSLNEIRALLNGRET